MSTRVSMAGYRALCACVVLLLKHTGTSSTDALQDHGNVGGRRGGGLGCRWISECDVGGGMGIFLSALRRASVG